VDRPLRAVILGTFTLRLSTGLTGGMLVYYLADLHVHGGPRVDAFTIGLMAALFYGAELLGSPAFGILSDRIGHRNVMLIGPAFGAVAVVITAFTTNIPLLGGTRVLEGLSTAASIPSILGFIAFATAGDELLRGRAVARFEAATLAGLMAGFVIAGPLFGLLGPAAFLANAFLYGVSYLVYRVGVPADAEPDPRTHPRRNGNGGLGRYLRILRGSHVWLIAPTWIALNATLGLYTSQTLFQLVNEPDPRFANQQLMGGFEPIQVSLGLLVAGVVFFAGLFWWGNRFRDLRRTTIILYGILGGGVMLLAGLAINHAAGFPPFVTVGLVLVALGALFVLAGATPAAIGLLADVTEAYPDDRGAIMGLYSVFLGVGQITGSLIGGGSAQVLGLDGIFLASLVLLGVALAPLAHLRRFEHYVGGPATPAILSDD
jgi:MFS family permease